jgi:hypothetical protein
MVSRKARPFVLAGVQRRFPRYVRTRVPRQSTPSSMWVTRVFSGESARPRSASNCSARGWASCSRKSVDLPVMRCQSGEGLAKGFPLVLHPPPLARTPHVPFDSRGSPSDFTTSCILYVAQALLGFSGSVPSPRRSFTPSELRSDWLPLPCDRPYRLPGGALLPRLLRSLCPAVPDHLKRGQPPPMVGRQTTAVPTFAHCASSRLP